MRFKNFAESFFFSALGTAVIKTVNWSKNQPQKFQKKNKTLYNKQSLLNIVLELFTIHGFDVCLVSTSEPTVHELKAKEKKFPNQFQGQQIADT